MGAESLHKMLGPLSLLQPHPVLLEVNYPVINPIAARAVGRPVSV